MTAPAAIEEYRALWKSGWQQGTLFEATGFTVPTQTATEKNVPLYNPGKQVKVTSRLILVTHDCDVLSYNETVVEAIVCSNYANNLDICKRADRNSARFFLIDPSTSLVAIATQRVLITKQSLVHLTPLGWPSDELRRTRFKRWLARRYDRYAWPDDFQTAFVNPLENVLTQLERDEPTVGDTVSRLCRECRVVFPVGDLPPFEVSLLLILAQDGLSTAEAEALDAFEERLRMCLDEGQVHLVEVRSGSLRQFSAEDFYQTAPLFLEPHTYRGEETIGSEPPSHF